MLIQITQEEREIDTGLCRGKMTKRQFILFFDKYTDRNREIFNERILQKKIKCPGSSLCETRKLINSFLVLSSVLFSLLRSLIVIKRLQQLTLVIKRRELKLE